MSLLIAIISWTVFGAVVGLIARAIMPGNQSMSFWATAALGVVGSVVGALLTGLILHHSMNELHPVGFVGSLIGAIVLLLVGRGLSRGRA